MNMLEAVNKVLRSIGESPVKTVVTSHPEVLGIIDTINQANVRRQERGWWFNQFRTTLAAPPTLPVGTVVARPVNRGLNVFAKGLTLMDRKTGQPFVGDPGEIDIQTLVPFDELPTEFAEFVVTDASVQYGIAYDADELHIKALQLSLEDARVAIHRLHIRYYEIDKANRRLQGRGWWFNQYRGFLPTDATGVVVGEDILYAKPLQRSLDWFPVKGRLIDRNTREVVKDSVEMDIRVLVPYDELPESFQAYVDASAEYERAQDYLPESSSIPRLQVEMQLAHRNAQQDHIKYEAVNLFSIPSTAGPIAKAWGSRYRR